MRSLLLILVCLLSKASVAFGAPEWEHPLYQAADRVFNVKAAYGQMVEEGADEAQIQEMKQMLVAAETAFISTTEDFLSKKGISYKIMSTTAAEAKAFGGEWKYFRLSTEGQSDLNQLALKLRNELKINFDFDPIRMRHVGGKGAYSNVDLTLYSSIAGLEIGASESTLQHEVLHARLDAMRRGVLPMDPATLALHITFRSARPIDPSYQMPTSYSMFMTFEEMATHAINVNYPAQRASEADQADLNSNIRRLREVSQYGKVASEKALTLLASGQNVIVEKDPATSQNRISTKDGNSFVLNVFVSEKDLARQSFDPKAYATELLGRAAQIAKFNLNYFKDFPPEGLKQEHIQKAKRFQEEQAKAFKAIADPATEVALMREGPKLNNKSQRQSRVTGALQCSGLFGF